MRRRRGVLAVDLEKTKLPWAVMQVEEEWENSGGRGEQEGRGEEGGGVGTRIAERGKEGEEREAEDGRG